MARTYSGLAAWVSLQQVLMPSGKCRAEVEMCQDMSMMIVPIRTTAV